MKPTLVRLVLVCAFALCGTQAVAPETFRFRDGDLVVQLTPDIPGGTLVMPLGPFGELSWHTHKGPINVEARFLVGRAARGLPHPSQFRDLRAAFVLRKVPWLLLTGLLLGSVLLEGPWRRRAGAMAVTTGALVLLVVLAVGVSAFTFDARALGDPRYRGPIRDAPRVLQLLKEVRRDWAGVQRNINRAVAGLQRLHTQVVGRVPEPSADTVRFLLISDIHNNPIGMLIAREIVGSFGIDAVLDAGDLTDRGTEIEGELFARFGSLDLPHVIAAGNHEDTATIERVARIDGVRFLEAGRGDTETVQGIEILGDADPNARSIASVPGAQVDEEAVRARCENLLTRFTETGADIVLVHDPLLGECVADHAEQRSLPLVFAWGHLHRPAYEVRGTVLSVSPGTSGAAGFKTDVVRPYGYAMLEFDARSRKPVAVCQFLFDSPSELRETSCHIASDGSPGEPALTPPPTTPPGSPR